MKVLGRSGLGVPTRAENDDKKGASVHSSPRAGRMLIIPSSPLLRIQEIHVGGRCTYKGGKTHDRPSRTESSFHVHVLLCNIKQAGPA